MHDTKIFRRHNIDAFTGFDSKTPGPERYQFTKQDGEIIKCEYLAQFMHENDSYRFLGWNTRDIIEAFPLCKYDSLYSMLKDFCFEWHDSVSNLIVDTKYTRIDAESLGCKITFKSELEYDTFNLAVEENKLSHGFKEYQLGIFYDGAQVNNSRNKRILKNGKRIQT